MDCKASLGMGPKRVHHRFDLSRQKRVIRIEQANYVSGTVAVGGVEISRHAAMRIAQQPYTAAAAHVRFNHLAGVVVRGIIADDNFRRRVGLRQVRFQWLGQRKPRS